MGKNLTKQQQNAIAIALVVVLGGGYVYWNYMLSGTLRSIQRNEKKLADLVKKIEKAERQARRLPALKSELETLQVELRDLEKQLPKDKDIPSVIRTITREALRENLQFTKVAPGKAKSKQYFEIIPFAISFDGSLHSLARFLASLGQQERIFKAGNIKLTPKNNTAIDGGTQLGINLDIETYAYKG